MLSKELEDFRDSIIGSYEELSQVKIEKGKMHKLLGIDKDKNISDVYTSGKKLAEDLLVANKGNKKTTAGMLAYAANINPEHNVFDKALKALKSL